MINHPNVNKILYGGDYNPEQWTPDIWEEDMKLLRKAGIDVVTINVFNWAMLQPDEITYDFAKLDNTVKMVTDNGMKICMGTSTAAHPAWMARKYPEILRVEFNGMKRKFGGRHNSCPNSLVYQKYATRLAKKLAQHYKDQENIVAWHVNNEYGGACYCENCEKAFRTWLQKKYQTLDALNRAWNTSFWGHTFYDWEDIVSPNLLSEHFEERRSMFQGISLDYARFNSDSMLENFKAEYQAIKHYMPEVPITTNLMGFYKPLNYKKWAKYMDFVSWDNYPGNEESYSETAMKHDLMRGLKDGLPFALMEQTPSVSNWLPDNSLKRPGVLRLWSYQAIAHGSDTVMYFQMRRSPGACEKFHGAVIDHVGTGNTRVFRECAELGEELIKLGDSTIGAKTPSKAAIVFDWDNWWAIEYSAGPNTNLRYVEEVLRYYQGFHKRNISVDIIGLEDDFSSYDLLVAPVLYMVKPGVDKRLEAYANNGGTLIITFLSGLTDENDYITVGGYPGKLRNLAGIWVEEFDSLPLTKSNTFCYQNKKYPAKMICDIIHNKGAKSLTFYEEDFYQGMPVITKNQFGSGKCYYVGTSSSDEFYQHFLKDICDECNISPIMEAPANVEVTQRCKNGKTILFILNHSNEDKKVIIPKKGNDLLADKGYMENEEVIIKSKGVILLAYEDIE
ncbi:MAG: beta-galactosidase [Clostridiales bacterium]|nr:beta-galactosidase [Clostridiales bacterium]